MKGVIKGMGSKQTYWIDGREVSRAAFKRAFPDRPLGSGEGITAWKRPVRSLGMGVHTSQIDEAYERNRKAGITGVTYDRETGEAIIHDRHARKQLMRVNGVFDRDGGYGDDNPPSEFTNSEDEGLGPEFT